MNKIFETSFFSETFSKLDNYQLNYAYNGDFSSNLTVHILNLVESSMDLENESSKTKKKVYFILVESLQNITRHQSKPDVDGLLDDFFIIQKTEESYLITSGNIIKTADVEPLKNKLQEINSLDPEKLRAYYQELLSNLEFSDKGGAGLGLLEMLRKSGNKLVFDFVKLNDTYTYFYFQAKVAKLGSENFTNAAGVENLNIAKSIHKTIVEHNLITVFHGQFGHDNLQGLLAMTESNVSGIDNVKFRKTIISVMIELLQNICFHADGKVDYEGEGPGLFMIAENGNSYSLITVNYIENSKTSAIESYVSQINLLSREELKTAFLEKLMRDDIDRKHGGGLGLLDVRIKTNNKVDLTIQPFSNELSYLIIIVQIDRKE